MEGMTDKQMDKFLEMVIMIVESTNSKEEALKKLKALRTK